MMLSNTQKYTQFNYCLQIIRNNSWGEIILFFLSAVAAYFLSSWLIYPGYILPLAAVHSDMYISLDLVESYPLWAMHLWPRCVGMMLYYLVSLIGFKFGIVFTISLTFINSALIFSILEDYYLGVKIPLLIAFIAQLTCFSLPDYAISSFYDWGVVAVFFGILGVFFLEKIKNKKIATFAFGVCAILSGLSKEHFLVPLELYALCYVFVRNTSLSRGILIIIIPVVAAGIMLIDAYLVHSPFIKLGYNATDPYYISLSIGSVLSSIGFYFQIFLHPIFIVSFLLLFILAYVRKRIILFSMFFILGFSCYLPYLTIPNHRTENYFWAGVPIFMALIPIAITPLKEKIIADCKDLLLICSLIIGTILFLNTCRKIDPGYMDWHLTQHTINKNVLDGLTHNQTLIQKDKNILVCGLDFPFHPWSHPGFLKRYLGYSGKWGLLLNKTLTIFPIHNDKVNIISEPSNERLSEYDHIFIFNTQGRLVDLLTPNEYIAKYRH